MVQLQHTQQLGQRVEEQAEELIEIQLQLGIQVIRLVNLLQLHMQPHGKRA